MRGRAPIALGIVLLAGLLAGLVAACQKPLPTITVYGEGKSVIVDAAAYQFSGGPTRRTISDYAQAPTISVPAGTVLLIDVPRTVAEDTWVVAAFRLDQAGKSTPIEGAGSLEPLHDRHSTRVSTSPAGLGDYYLQVAQLRGTTQAGGWVIKVRTKS